MSLPPMAVDVFSRFGITQNAHTPLRAELCALYAAPERHYHNQQHLLQCLMELRNSPNPDQPAIEVALWFHDAIYDPRRSDNEQRSAELAAARLSEVKLPDDFIHEVTRLILATVHKSSPVAADEQLIVDIDLAILGQPQEIFDAYEGAIR